jgi:hypothetical protein
MTSKQRSTTVPSSECVLVSDNTCKKSEGLYRIVYEQRAYITQLHRSLFARHSYEDAFGTCAETR